MTSDEFVSDLLGIKNSGEGIDDTDSCVSVKYATVVELFSTGTAKIQFAGEDIPSEKEYAYLDRYVPQKGDKVLLIKARDVYVIVDKVVYKEAPNKLDLSGFATSDELRSAIDALALLYVPQSTLDTTISNAITTAITTALSGYVKTSALSDYAKTTALSDYVKRYSGSYVLDLSESASLATVISKINSLLAALRNSGLLRTL